MIRSREWPEDSIGELIAYLAPAIWPRGQGSGRPRRAPGWPPDVFAVCAYVLNTCGAYRRLIGTTAVDMDGITSPEWPRRAATLGRAWRKSIEVVSEADLRPSRGTKAGGTVSPKQLNASPSVLRARSPEIDNWWQALIRLGATPLAELYDHPELPALLMQLLTVADEACDKVGKLQDFSRFHGLTNLALANSQYVSLCADVSTAKACVLPKQHTPLRGLTLRSLTHHLALVPPGDVKVRWWSDLGLADGHWDDTELNVLLAPWPRRFPRGCFERRNGVLGEGFGAFGFWPVQSDPATVGADSASDAELAKYLHRALSEAREHVDQVHMLVMPEAAMTLEQYEQVVEPWAIDSNIVVVAGICDRKEDLSEHYNRCVLGYLGLAPEEVQKEAIGGGIVSQFRFTQAKRHRWLLDRSQIVQYGLSGRIPALFDGRYWEDIAIEPGIMDMVTLFGWLTCGALVCEDLARQDHVSESIRAVGPNLLVALLMDGPQIRQRWPARYASVLADDPGSSVLTITSQAMANLSSPRPGEADRSGVIALWHDSVMGEVEIELSAGEDAAVLSLVRHGIKEFTADGRVDTETSHPVFAGYVGIRTETAEQPDEG